MATEESLLWKIDSDLLSNRKIGQQHELLNQHVRFCVLIVVAICSTAIFIQVEHEFNVPDPESAILEATLTQVAGKFLPRVVLKNSKGNSLQSEENSHRAVQCLRQSHWLRDHSRFAHQEGHVLQ